MGGILEGIKVVDVSRILAGPFATQMLADLGAEDENRSTMGR